MDMFGLTLAGYDDYLRKIMRQDYQEPTKIPSIKEILEQRLRWNPNLSFAEAYNKLDPVIGTADGFSYGSCRRLYLQRRKGLLKPVGPIDMYRLPPTEGHVYGFWTNRNGSMDVSRPQTR